MEKGQTRVLSVLVVTLFLWAGLIGRLFFVQIVQHEHHSRLARLQQIRRVELPPARGRILDRNGRPLAENLKALSVSANPAKIQNKRSTARILAQILPVSEGELLEKLSKKENFVWLARQVPPSAAHRVTAKNIPHIHVWDEMKRVYPMGELGRPLVGFTDVDGKGIEGVECEMDRLLKGTPGWVTLFSDVKGKRFPLPKSHERPPVPGYDMILTIDASYQSVVETKLREGIAKHNAKCGSVILLAPRTGEILAMASEPNPRIGSNRAGMSRTLRNSSIADQFEPGSTFKIVTASAALSAGVCDTSSRFDGENGEKDFGGYTIHDSKPHGWLSFRDAVALSSNVCLAKVGLKVGREGIYRYTRAFGFGSPTGLQLPGETPGRVRPLQDWSARSLSTLSIGQELGVTAIQLAMAYGAIANGGLLLKPSIIKTIVDEKGNTVKKWKPQKVRRVVSEEVARTLRDFLKSAVDYGTGTEASLTWVSCAGKTGTAQKYDAQGGGYNTGKYVSSFVGFMPAEEPELLCLVIVDEPLGSYYGGTVSAPIFKEIFEVIGRFPMGPVRPRYPKIAIDSGEDEKGRAEVPDIRFMEWQQAKAVLEELGFRVRIVGTGRRVSGESPSHGEVVAQGSEVTLTLLDEERKQLKTPNVMGLTLREAARVLSESLLSIEVEGSGSVVRQNPMPGTEVIPGTICRLECSE